MFSGFCEYYSDNLVTSQSKPSTVTLEFGMIKEQKKTQHTFCYEVWFYHVWFKPTYLITLLELCEDSILIKILEWLFSFQKLLCFSWKEIYFLNIFPFWNHLLLLAARCLAPILQQMFWISIYNFIMYLLYESLCWPIVKTMNWTRKYLMSM